MVIYEAVDGGVPGGYPVGVKINGIVVSQKDKTIEGFLDKIDPIFVGVMGNQELCSGRDINDISTKGGGG